MYVISAMLVSILLAFRLAVMFQCLIAYHVKMTPIYVTPASVTVIIWRPQSYAPCVRMLYPFALGAPPMELFVSNALLDLFSIFNFTVKNVVILWIIADYATIRLPALAA